MAIKKHNKNYGSRCSQVEVDTSSFNFHGFFFGQLPSGWSLGRRTWALGCSGCYCERRASRPGIYKEVCSNSWPFRQQENCLPWPDWSARWTNMPMPPRAGFECSKTAACQLHAVKVMLTFCDFARCFPSFVYAFPHNHFAGGPVQYTHLHAAWLFNLISSTQRLCRQWQCEVCQLIADPFWTKLIFANSAKHTILIAKRRQNSKNRRGPQWQKQRQIALRRIPEPFDTDWLENKSKSSIFICPDSHISKISNISLKVKGRLSVYGHILSTC